MGTRSALVVTLLALAAGVGLTASQGQPPAVDPSQQPTFRTGAEAVAVDVSVLDRQGRPIQGLKADDFTVLVAGEPRRIISAEYVQATTGASAAAGIPAPRLISTNEGGGAGRLYVFIVDQATLETGSARTVARAASKFLDRLTFNDRSSLILIPVGRNVNFTWNHDRVQESLAKVVGLGNIVPEWPYGSLSEARDIANRNQMVLRNVQDRECRGSMMASGGGGGSPAPTGAPAGGSGGGGGGDSGGGGAGGGSQSGSGDGTPVVQSGSAGGGRGQNRGGAGLGGGLDTCSRDIQMQAEFVWREVQMTSFSTLTALRHALTVLARVRGEKTIVFMSGGLALDEREHTSVLAAVADDAAAANATFHTFFVPSSTMSVTRRTMSASPIMDQQVHSWPLETLAGMTGGSAFRADVGADGVFDRLGRELSGYYRLGVVKLPGDTDARGRKLKVQVAGASSAVRHREIFDVRTYEDRDWTARLADALFSPVAATGLGVRVTSYLAADPENTARLKLVLAGEATRMQPGKATFQVVVRNLEGDEVTSGEQPLGEVNGDYLPFSTTVPMAPGRYVVRLAIMDSGGRVGSVDHRVDVNRVALGPLSASGPMLVRVPSRREAEPRLALDGVRQDERLALQVDLTGEESRLTGANVVFEIAATPDGPALVTSVGEAAPGTSASALVSQAVTDVRVLPPGDYVARARVMSASEESIGELHRAFTITPAPKLIAERTTETVAAPVRPAPERLTAQAANAVPRFALDQVLSPTIVGNYLDRATLQPKSSSPAMRDLVERARTDSIRNLVVPDSLTAEEPVVAPFIKGLSLLAQGKVDPAAAAFRSAMRANTDFYPAMVYLGACYAAKGQDKEAAGAWNTALIRERDALPVHVLLADALMRSGRGDLALQALDRARARWPEDNGLARRFAVAAVAGGRYADGLAAVDDLVERKSEDEAVLALALLTLYEAFKNEKPIESLDQDRARMTRLADAYRTRGGPSLALVETWVAAAKKAR